MTIFGGGLYSTECLSSSNSTKGTMEPEGSARNSCNSAAGHCTHAELTSRHALASCYSFCVHSRGLC